MIKGSCLCGEVKFEISGTPWALTYCHCSRCRKAAGVYSAILSGPVDDLTITNGEEAITRYRTDAHPKYRRAFCRHCGSSLGVLETDEGIYAVAASALDDDPQVRPSIHFHTVSKPCWYEIDDDLQKFDGDYVAPG